MKAGQRPWRWMWRSSWQRQADWAGARVPLVGLAFLWLFGGLGYALISRALPHVGVLGWTPILALDREIPALAWTLIPYASFYALFALSAERARARGIEARREYVLLCQGMQRAIAVSFACFVLLPCEVEGRGQLLETAGASWLPLVRILHWLDPPFNAWPSLHISLSLMQVLWLCECQRRSSRRVLLWSWWLAIGASTLTTKQHYVFDLLSGSLLGALLWWAQVRPALARVRADPRAFDEALA